MAARPWLSFPWRRKCNPDSSNQSERITSGGKQAPSACVGQNLRQVLGSPSPRKMRKVSGADLIVSQRSHASDSISNLSTRG
jgi:hypothetical protein